MYHIGLPTIYKGIHREGLKVKVHYAKAGSGNVHLKCTGK